MVNSCTGIRNWPHSGYCVDQSAFLPACDAAGIERLIQYMTRCGFSLSRLVRVSDTVQVIYKFEKQACRAFPVPKSTAVCRSLGHQEGHQICMNWCPNSTTPTLSGH